MFNKEFMSVSVLEAEKVIKEMIKENEKNFAEKTALTNELINRMKHFSSNEKNSYTGFSVNGIHLYFGDKVIMKKHLDYGELTVAFEHDTIIIKNHLTWMTLSHEPVPMTDHDPRYYARMLRGFNVNTNELEITTHYNTVISEGGN